MMSKQQNPVANVYQTVIEDVINNVRELFLDDGVDEQVLQELKQIWEGKLKQTRAVDSPIMGDRSNRPPMYTFMSQTGLSEGGQSMYRTVQLSSTSQQARLAVPAGAVYQQDANLRFPAQTFQQYQPVRLLQHPLQISHQRPAGGSGQTIVVPSTSQPAGSQVARPKNPSGIVQADGSSESLEDEGPSTSGASSRLNFHPGIIQTDGSNDFVEDEEPSTSGACNFLRQNFHPGIIHTNRGNDSLEDEEPSTSGACASSRQNFHPGITQTDRCTVEEGPSIPASCTSSMRKLHPKEMSRPKKYKFRNTKMVLQLDGRNDSSSSEVDEDDDDDDDDDEDDDEETQEEEEKIDEEPLNSADDDSDQDSTEMFDTDNVIVCQYDKIHRAKTKWKFNLKLGIMNLKGKDHVFVKANGDAEW